MSSPANQRLVASIFAAASMANESWPRERAAAVKIQSATRMHQQRRRFLFVRKCAVQVQRIFRGYCGRVRVLDEKIEEARQHQQRIFHCHARNIQRVFRGFLCRKYTNDFCAMKAYLARITQTSEGVRQAALQARQDQEAFLEKEQARELRQDFDGAIRNSHHLLSTAVCAGVLRAPLQPDGTKTVFGTDIEEEIRGIPIERPKRSKFLKDIIPPSSSSEVSPTNYHGSRKAASTGRVGAAAAAAAAVASSSGASGSGGGSSSQQQGKKRLNFSAPKKPYQRSLHSEESYGSSDSTGGGVDRMVEEQVVASLHGPKGAFFHVPHKTERGPKVASGFTSAVNMRQ